MKMNENDDDNNSNTENNDNNNDDDDNNNNRRKHYYRCNMEVLEDPFPSAFHIYITCRKVLWGIVESINNDESNDIDDIYNYNELSEMSLPIQFESRKAKRQKRSVEKVLKRSNNDFPFMDNIYMVMHHDDSKFYPAEVIGVGPSKPPLSTSIVRFISYGNTCEVNRSTGLVKVPIYSKYCIDKEVMNCYDFSRPLDVHEKYWDQRYRLLSKYDHGIQLDAESWYSITPEIIAKHVAKRCLEQFNKHNIKLDMILDCFCGCGGNSIAFAEICENVISIDIDPEKILKLINNAKIYDVNDHIKPVCSDVYDVLNKLHDDKFQIGNRNWKSYINLIVLSPPWGGVDYVSDSKDIIRNFPSGDGYKLIELALTVCSNVVCIFPRTTKNKFLKDLARRLCTKCVVDDIHLYRKQKMKIYYFGNIFYDNKLSS